MSNLECKNLIIISLIAMLIISIIALMQAEERIELLNNTEYQCV